MSTNYSKCTADILFNAIPMQNWTGSGGSLKSRLLEFLDNRYMRVGRLSVLRTGRCTPQETCVFLVLIYVKGWVDPQGHNSDGRWSH